VVATSSFRALASEKKSSGHLDQLVDGLVSWWDVETAVVALRDKISRASEARR